MKHEWTDGSREFLLEEDGALHEIETAGDSPQTGAVPPFVAREILRLVARIQELELLLLPAEVVALVGDERARYRQPSGTLVVRDIGKTVAILPPVQEMLADRDRRITALEEQNRHLRYSLGMITP